MKHRFAGFVCVLSFTASAQPGEPKVSLKINKDLC